MKNLLRQVKPIIYRLKKDYGLEAWIFQPVSTTQNIETGKTIREYSILNVKKAILLPVNWQRTFNYDLSYIASGKNFVYGGFYDVGQREMMVDADDLPSGTVITNNDFVVYDGRHYEIKSPEVVGENQSYIFIVKTVASYDAIAPIYGVTESTAATVNYRINTSYFENGVQNGLSAYCSVNGKYWIWYNTATTSWIISTVKGTLGSYYWTKGNATITGTYTAGGTATGSVIVAAL